MCRNIGKMERLFIEHPDGNNPSNFVKLWPINKISLGEGHRFDPKGTPVTRYKPILCH